MPPSPGPPDWPDRCWPRWSGGAPRRSLPAARRQVWADAVDLHEARQRGPACYRGRLAELDVLTAAKIADLLRPGPVLLRLALDGFGSGSPRPERAGAPDRTPFLRRS